VKPYRAVAEGGIQLSVKLAKMVGDEWQRLGVKLINKINQK